MSDPIKQPNKIPGYSAPAMSNAGAASPFARPTAPNIYDFVHQYKNQNQNTTGADAVSRAMDTRNQRVVSSYVKEHPEVAQYNAKYQDFRMGKAPSGQTVHQYLNLPAGMVVDQNTNSVMYQDDITRRELKWTQPWKKNPNDWRRTTNNNGTLTYNYIGKGPVSYPSVTVDDPKAVQGMLNSQRAESEAKAYQQKQKQKEEEAYKKMTDGSYWGIMRNNIQAFRTRAGASLITTGLELGNNIYGITGLIGDGLGIDSMRDWGYKHFMDNRRTIQEFNDEVKADNPWSMYTPEWAKEFGDFGAKYTPDVAAFALSLGTSALSQAGTRVTTQAATQATTQAATRATTQAAAKETAKNVSKYIPKKMVKYVDDVAAKAKPPGPVARQVKPIAKAVLSNPVSDTKGTSESVGMLVDMRTEQPVQEQPQIEHDPQQGQQANTFDVNQFMDAMAPMMMAGYNSQTYQDNSKPYQFNGNTTSYYRS